MVTFVVARDARYLFVCARLEWWLSAGWEGAHHTSLHTPRAVAQAQSLELFFPLVVFPFSCVDLDVVFRAAAVLSDLQRAR